jgi:hypothetical protein
VRLLPYTKRSIQYAVVSAVLFALLVVIRELAWRSASFNADVGDGGGFVTSALVAMYVIGLTAIILLAFAIFYAITSQGNRWK